jgi:hypothetical protein
MMGESNIASPPPQTVATSGGAAPVPLVQERLVVAPQNFAGGPAGSPSEHVSFSASCHGGSPRASSCADVVFASLFWAEPPSHALTAIAFSCSLVSERPSGWWRST